MRSDRITFNQPAWQRTINIPKGLEDHGCVWSAPGKRPVVFGGAYRRHPGCHHLSQVRRSTPRLADLENFKSSGADPWSFYRDILRNENAPFLARRDAAEKLLAYGHPKWTSVEAASGGTSHQERLATPKRMWRDQLE